MKYIFFGSPELAAIILEKLINAGFIPEAVVCNPDKPVGRKKIVTPPAVKQRIMNYELSIKNKIQIFQPEKLDPSLFIIPNSSFDLFIVAAYSKLIPKEILKIPKFGTIGVHPSLLPKYRGATPIQTAILNGDEITGTTLYLMDEKMDNGPVLATSHLPLATSETYETLMRKLAELSANLLIKTLLNIENKIEPSAKANPRTISLNGEIGAWVKKAKLQNEAEAIYTKKFIAENAFIEPEDLKKAQNNSVDSSQIALQIERKIRALNPEPGVFTFINNKRTKLLEAEIIDRKLKLTKIQTEGKKPTLVANC